MRKHCATGAVVDAFTALSDTPPTTDPQTTGGLPKPEQLAFGFPLHRDYSFASFEVGDSAEAVAQLSQLPRLQGFVGTWLWGERGVGKTHLLQAACHLHGGRAGYLPLGQIDDPQVLQGPEQLRLLALDDVDGWVGDREPEIALQAVYQGMVNSGGKLLIATATAPALLQAQLPDVVSRLRAMNCYEVRGLSDTQKIRVLQHRAKEKGLIIEGAVMRYWLRRADRRMPVLLAQLQTLLDAALDQQRRVTIPMLKRTLGF